MKLWSSVLLLWCLEARADDLTAVVRAACEHVQGDVIFSPAARRGASDYAVAHSGDSTAWDRHKVGGCTVFLKLTPKVKVLSKFDDWGSYSPNPKFSIPFFVPGFEEPFVTVTTGATGYPWETSLLGNGGRLAHEVLSSPARSVRLAGAFTECSEEPVVLRGECDGAPVLEVYGCQGREAQRRQWRWKAKKLEQGAPRCELQNTHILAQAPIPEEEPLWTIEPPAVPQSAGARWVQLRGGVGVPPGFRWALEVRRPEVFGGERVDLDLYGGPGPTPVRVDSVLLQRGPRGSCEPAAFLTSLSVEVHACLDGVASERSTLWPALPEP